MATPKFVEVSGNQLLVHMTDASKFLAYPTGLGVWYVNGAGDPPDPGTGTLVNYNGSVNEPVDGWESHASYSRGGTDWPFGLNQPIKAPASGTLVNYPDSDAAGLKSMLILDEPAQRRIAASNTLMNGVYRETEGGDTAVAYMIQHLNTQVAEGHYDQNTTIGFAGNTAGPGNTGDQHLHAHLLAQASVGGNRLDFMKFAVSP
jgi:hypothetical protein